MSEQRYTEKYWQAELQRAEKDLDDKGFRDNAEESIQVYEGSKSIEEGSRKLNIWWAVNQTVLPAYYSQQPQVEVQLRKKTGDELARNGAIVSERASQYCIDEEFNFDCMAQHALLDYLLTGRGAIRAKYEANTEPKLYEYAVYKGEDGTFKDAEGKACDCDPESVAEGEDGVLTAQEVIPQLKGQRALLERIHWRDYREQCARQPSEVAWKGVRGYLSRDEAKRTLGKDIADKLKFTAFPDENHKRGDSSNLYEGKAETWEIWCEESGKVYFFSGAGNEAVIEPSAPPLTFADFYPFSVLGQNIRLNSNIPQSDYALLKDQILEVERLTTRIHATLAALKYNAMYDSALGAEIEKLFSGDLKLIPVKFPGYKGEQALARAIEANPLIALLVGALETLSNAREVALAKIYEQTGSSDIIRGMTDPRETLGAQEIKNSRANWRFGFRQKHIQDWFGGAIGKLTEIICTQYKPDKLYETSNIGQMIGPIENFLPVAEFLKSEPGRRYKISIKTDSMGAVDEAQDHKDRTDLMASCGAFLGQIDGIIQQHPSLATVAMEMMKYTVRTYKSGKDLEPVFMQAVQQIAQEVQQKMAAPQPGAQDAQVKLQIAQMDNQLQQQKIQAEMQTAAGKAQNDAQIEASKAQVEQMRVQMEGEKLALEHSQFQVETAMRSKELELKLAEMQLKMQEMQANTAAKINDTQINAQMAQIQAAVEAEKAAVERMRVQLEGYEKLIEEKRLALEARTKMVESAQSQQAQPKQAERPPSIPPMNIYIDAKPGKRKSTMRKATDGSVEIESDNG